MKQDPSRLGRRTARLDIRSLSRVDYAAWREAFLRLPKNQRNHWDQRARPAKELTRERFAKMLRAQKRLRDRDFYYDFAIFRRTDGALLGGVSLMEVRRAVSQTCFLGYFILNPHWGQGYAKEAVKAAYEIAFKDLRLHRVEAGIEPGNTRSIRMAKSLKMRYEGLKKRCIFLRGKWVDLLMYTVTCEDLGLRFRGPRPGIKSRV